MRPDRDANRCSGSPAAFERAKPVLEAAANKIWRLGNETGAGSTVKAVNQLLAGVPHVLAGNGTPHSVANIFVKDLGTVPDQARGLRFPLPLAAAAHQLFLAAAAGHGAKDDAFVIRVREALSGIELPKGGHGHG